jgi:predicted RNase H-like nuclease (RuvC/YqgF family)
MKSIRRWNKKIAISVLIITSSLVAVHIIQAATAEPGTDADPLVTKSYVDQKFESFSGIKDLDSKISALTTKNEELATKDAEQTKKIEELTKALNDLYEKNDEYKIMTEELETRLESIETYGKFVALELTENQKLMTGESAEIILRGGKAKAIGGEGGGLSDITSGTGADVNTDQDVPLNHLLLVSRDDGRGIKIVSKKAWVLVKGPYTIEEK